VWSAVVEPPSSPGSPFRRTSQESGEHRSDRSQAGPAALDEIMTDVAWPGLVTEARSKIMPDVSAEARARAETGRKAFR